MRTAFLLLFVFCLYTSVTAACLYKQLGGCPNYDVSTGVVTCPVSCANTCSCSGTSPLCSCGAPPCSCIRDTADVCQSCKPEPSPICSCLSALDVPCNCETRKSFVYFPEVTYPLTALEMNPFYYSTCFSY
ncbi:hypothetical protein evm_005047 [Chilo suppressalis]|nr:hypothetical protein evm_005047 [Chilo suppressalis]